MAKCGVFGCKGEVMGGFQAVNAVGHMHAPHVTIVGGSIFWCEEHEGVLTQGLGYGRFFADKELEEA
jgi:hypothetical protein